MNGQTQTPGQFLCSMDRAAREGGTNTHGAYFRHLFVVCSITKSGQARWRAGMGMTHGIPYSALHTTLDKIVAEYAAEEARGTRVPMHAEAGYVEGQAPTVSLRGTVQLRHGNHYFGVGAVARGQKGRKEYQGEMVDGPWAYTYGLATCLMGDGYDAQRDADAKARAKAIEVNEGTKLLIDGITYTAHIVRREFIELEVKS